MTFHPKFRTSAGNMVDSDFLRAMNWHVEGYIHPYRFHSLTPAGRIRMQRLQPIVTDSKKELFIIISTQHHIDSKGLAWKRDEHGHLLAYYFDL